MLLQLRVLLVLLNMLFIFHSQAADNNYINDETLKFRIYTAVNNRFLDSDLFALALKRENTDLRVHALQGLGRIGGEKIISLVTPALNDTSHRVRRAVYLALGLSASKTANPYLWRALEQEAHPIAKQEIYLALGVIGEKGLIVNLLNRLPLESSEETKSSIFQSLAIALTFHSEIGENISEIDFSHLLKLVYKDNKLSGRALYFLSRLPNIEHRIKPEQIASFIDSIISLNNKPYLARFLGKITKISTKENRHYLSWLISQSEQKDINLVAESIRAMSHLVEIPQAKIQLGKLQASSNYLVAQTALKVLSDSTLKGREIETLLKQNLKHSNNGMVVEAISGLVKRQTKEQMTWAVKILQHKSAFIKINLARILFEKNKIAFANVIKRLGKDKDENVATYARNLLSSRKTVLGKNTGGKVKQAFKSTEQKVELNTTSGIIVLQMLPESPFTALNFITLVKDGFYDGSFFSRVIGDFVAQGGDNTGDGDGSSQKSIREEISYLNHLPGTVGMATNGKDTGDSQFFINTAENTHLDRNYTIFAIVVVGMESVYKISNGDQILSAKIL